METNVEDDNYVMPKIKPKKDVRWLDIITLLILAFAFGLVYYDYTNLHQIEQRCLNQCNEHWFKQLPELHCAGYDIEPGKQINYSYAMPTINFSKM